MKCSTTVRLSKRIPFLAPVFYLKESVYHKEISLKKKKKQNKNRTKTMGLVPWNLALSVARAQSVSFDIHSRKQLSQVPEECFFICALHPLVTVSWDSRILIVPICLRWQCFWLQRTFEWRDFFGKKKDKLDFVYDLICGPRGTHHLVFIAV